MERFKPFIILKKLQRALAFFFFFFYFHKSKLDALSPHYFIARVIRRSEPLAFRQWLITFCRLAIVGFFQANFANVLL